MDLTGRNTETDLIVDPVVSRAKFEHELAQYRKMEDSYLRRGWWMLRAEYPEIFVVFATPQLKPPSVVFGALLDFTNYDFWPPSVRLVDPFTRVPYKGSELPTVLKRRVQPTLPPELAAQGYSAEPQPQPIMQYYEKDPEDVPFLCLPGVREYHRNPAHTADDWLLHRSKGEGTLYFLLEKLHRYGVQPLDSYQIQMQIVVTGYAQSQIPE
jgi:hypothetical protein